jgi:NAD(P)-dependent dehydrogenase (short-subunit alcohol dehydrogenase family)
VDLRPDTPEIAADISSSNVVGFTADVCDRNALDDAVAHLCERFGRVDVAIANAGIMGQGSTLRATPAPAIDKVLAVNINGVVNTVNAAMEQIIANQGQVVLISSVFAFLNGVGAIPYAMSKAAVEQLGRGLRVELARHGASATTAYFSLIQTDMIRNGVDADPAITEMLARIAGAAAQAPGAGPGRRSRRAGHRTPFTPCDPAGSLGPAVRAARSDQPGDRRASGT